MMTVESLRAAGANVEEGLSRCLNKEDFYLKMVNMGLNNQNFQLLGSALEAKDFDRAFELCHSLKGVIGNLSLTPLYDLICQLTEMLCKQKVHRSLQSDYDDAGKTSRPVRGNLSCWS